MRIDLDILRRYLPEIPADPSQTRHLMDDLGLEVKRLNNRTFTLELLANRGDHRCYAGVARELAGRIGGSLKLPQSQSLVLGDGYLLRLRTDACFAYSATPLKVKAIGQLPPEAIEVLDAAGLRSVSPIVDATNIANLELGQPTHAFDADKVQGPITIRRTGIGERAWPLFTEGHRELPEGTLVIADDEKILAIAGVIGCEDSKVTDESQNILLESACFDPILVNKASRKLGIQTDASARFERGADPGMVLTGAGRVVELLKGLVEVTGPTSYVTGSETFEREISIELDRIQAYYGLPVTVARVREILEALGFEVTENHGIFHVLVPGWRWWDVKSFEDILEEIGRSIGYNEVPASLPPVALGAVLTPIERLRESIRAVLTGAGFYEVITDGFYGRGDREALGIQADHPLWPHVETLNSVDKGFSLLKNNGLAQALTGVVDSQNMSVEQFRVFELTRTFHPDAKALNGFCREEACVTLIVSGLERDADWAHKPGGADIYLLKGLVEEIGLEAGVELKIELKSTSQPEFPLMDLLHPHRRACLTSGGAMVGVLGEAHPRLIKSYGIRRSRPLYLELRLSGLAPVPVVAVSVPGTRPPSVRSLAFTLPLGVEAASVSAILRAHGHARLERVEVVDLFAHEVDGKPVRTLTYLLSYQNEDASMSIETINAATEALIVAVEAGPWGVKLRR